MKKALLIIAGVIVVLVAAVVVVPGMIDWSGYVAQAMRDATGRDARIDGEVRVSLLPSVEVTASGVHLANAPDAARPEMISVGDVDVRVDPFPLIFGTLAVDRFIVRGASANLSIDETGRGNWVFAESNGGGGAKADRSDRQGGDAGLPFKEIRLGEVRIEQSAFSFEDARTGQKIEAADIELSASLPDLSSPFALSLAMTLNREPVKLTVNLDAPAALDAEKTAQLDLALAAERINAGYKGGVQAEPVPGLDGEFRLDIPSVGNLAAWLGRPLASGQPDPGPLKVKAVFAGGGEKVALTEAVIEGSGLEATAEGSYDGSADPAKIALRLNSGVLDIDRYLPPPADTGGAPADTGGAPPKQSRKPERPSNLLETLSDERFELDALRKTEAEVDIAIGGIRAMGYEIGPIALTSTLKGGVLQAELARLDLYRGNVTGKLKLDGSGDELSAEAALRIADIEAGRLSRVAMPEGPKLKGAFSGSLDATARGESPRAVAESLTTKATFALGGVEHEAATVSDITTQLSVAGTAGRPELSAGAVYNGEPVKLHVELDPLKSLLAEDSFAAGAKLDSKPVQLAYEGKIQHRPVPGLDGTFGLNVPSAGKLAAWLGQPLPEDQPDPGPLKVDATFASDGKVVSLEKAAIEGKALKATASARFDGSEPVAEFRFDAEVQEADLNAYLPPRREGKAVPAKPASKAGPAPKAAPAQGWSEEPIDATALRKANGEANVRIAKIRYRDLEIESGQANLTLKDGKLDTAVKDLKLAGGSLNATAGINAAGDSLQMSYDVTGADLQARPLLKAAADTDRLSGTASFNAKGQASGRSEKALVSSLNGDGEFKFLDGAIHGVNIAATLRKAKTLGQESEAGEARKTDFAELSGSFKITDGVVENRDFKMLAPLLRLSGEGTVPLPPRTVDYLTTAKLVGSLKGQTGQEALAGIPIPIKVSGPWSNVAYRVDWQSAFREAAKDPARLKAMPDQLRDAAKDFGVSLPKLPGLSGDSGGTTGSGESSPLDSLKEKVLPSNPEGSSDGGTTDEKEATDPTKSLKGLFGK